MTFLLQGSRVWIVYVLLLNLCLSSRARKARFLQLAIYHPFPIQGASNAAPNRRPMSSTSEHPHADRAPNVPAVPTSAGANSGSRYSPSSWESPRIVPVNNRMSSPSALTAYSGLAVRDRYTPVASSSLPDSLGNFDASETSASSATEERYVPVSGELQTYDLNEIPLEEQMEAERQWRDPTAKASQEIESVDNAVQTEPERAMGGDTDNTLPRQQNLENALPSEPGSPNKHPSASFELSPTMHQQQPVDLALTPQYTSGMSFGPSSPHRTYTTPVQVSAANVLPSAIAAIRSSQSSTDSQRKPPGSAVYSIPGSITNLARFAGGPSVPPVQNFGAVAQRENSPGTPRSPINIQFARQDTAPTSAPTPVKPGRPTQQSIPFPTLNAQEAVQPDQRNPSASFSSPTISPRENVHVPLRANNLQVAIIPNTTSQSQTRYPTGIVNSQLPNSNSPYPIPPLPLFPGTLQPAVTNSFSLVNQTPPLPSSQNAQLVEMMRNSSTFSPYASQVPASFQAVAPAASSPSMSAASPTHYAMGERPMGNLQGRGAQSNGTSIVKEAFGAQQSPKPTSVMNSASQVALSSDGNSQTSSLEQLTMPPGLALLGHPLTLNDLSQGTGPPSASFTQVSASQSSSAQNVAVNIASNSGPSGGNNFKHPLNFPEENFETPSRLPTSFETSSALTSFLAPQPSQPFPLPSALVHHNKSSNQVVGGTSSNGTVAEIDTQNAILQKLQELPQRMFKKSPNEPPQLSSHVRLPSLYSLSLRDACIAVMRYGKYRPDQICCSVKNGIWSYPQTWGCNRSPTLHDVAVVLHHVELIDPEVLHSEIRLRGVFVISTKTQQASLRAGFPFWDICKTHLLNSFQRSSHQRKAYRFPWTSFNQTLNREFSDYLRQGYALEDICQRFLGSNIVKRRQTAYISVDASDKRNFGSDSRVLSRKNASSHSIGVDIPEANGVRGINQGFYAFRSLLPTPNLQESATPFSGNRGAGSAGSGEDASQAPLIIVGQHAALLFFDGISVHVGEGGVVENSGTMFLGPNIDRACYRDRRDDPLLVVSCLKSSLVLEDGVSLLAHRPIRITRLELRGVTTGTDSSSSAEWQGRIGYPPSFPDSEVSALIIHHGVQRLRTIAPTTALAFKRLEIAGLLTEVPAAMITLVHPEETSLWSLTFFIDMILSEHKRAFVAVNGLGLKLGKYEGEQLYVLHDISLASKTILVDREVVTFKRQPPLESGISLLRFFCTLFCDVNNQIYHVETGHSHVQLIAGGL